MSAASDDQIFQMAAAESSVIVTVDLDFSRIIALSGQNGPGIILFRAGNVSDAEMLVLLRRVLEEVDEATLTRSVVVVEEERLRIASLPIGQRR